MEKNKLKPWRRIGFILNLPSSLLLVWRLLRDRRVPSANKGLFIILALGYLSLPTDLIPDFIPGFGQLDDLGVILFLIDKFIQYAPPQVLNELKLRSRHDS